MSTALPPAAKATWTLCLLCIFVYAFGNPWWLWLWPYGSAEFRWWQFVTYAFTHGNWMHLAINLLALLSFGPFLERRWGRFPMLGVYLTGAIGGAGLQMADSSIPMVGASAGLFALFAAYTLLRPKAQLVSLFVVPLPAWAVLPIYGALSVLAWMQGWLPGVAHLAHVGGAVTGILFALVIADKEKPRQ